ncbi:MAG: long-chain-fatty-acid--CoA ligase [Nitrososphaerota archaeon]
MSFDYPLTINRILTRTLYRKSPSQIVYGKTRYTWLEFHDRITKLASSLESIGVKKGTKVGVIDFDTNRYLECYYTIPMMGAILHTINLRLPPEHLIYTIENAEDEFLIVTEDFLPLIMKTLPSLTRIKGVITMSDSGSAPQFQGRATYFYDDLLSRGDPSYTFKEPSENDVATLFYTSGTTGFPKGVWFTHRQIVLHSLATMFGFFFAAKGHGLEATDVMMPLVPFFHVHSWGMPYNAGFMGMKLVLCGKYDPKNVLELLKNERVTFSSMVPTILNMIVNYPEVDNYIDALSKWKVVVGGAALPRGLALRAIKLGIKVMSGYGLSETAPVLTLATPTERYAHMSDEDLLDSVLLKTGLPIPLVELRVVNSEMNDVPRDNRTFGEIIVRAPWLTKEYYKDPEKSSQLWAGGWLHTGDLAVMDDEGYITIVDRLRDAIRSGGEWISTIVLEDLIIRHPAVIEAAVIGVKDDRWGERPLAVVYTKQKLDPAELREYMMKFVDEGKIARFWIPDRFVIVNEPLPKTSTGKIDKKPLRANIT